MSTSKYTQTESVTAQTCATSTRPDRNVKKSVLWEKTQIKCVRVIVPSPAGYTPRRGEKKEKKEGHQDAATQTSKGTKGKGRPRCKATQTPKHGCVAQPDPTTPTHVERGTSPPAKRCRTEEGYSPVCTTQALGETIKYIDKKLITLRDEITECQRATAEAPEDYERILESVQRMCTTPPRMESPLDDLFNEIHEKEAGTTANRDDLEREDGSFEKWLSVGQRPRA